MTSREDFRFSVPTMSPEDIAHRQHAAEYVEHTHSDWHGPHIQRFMGIHEWVRGLLAASGDPILTSRELVWPKTGIGAVPGTRTLSLFRPIAEDGSVAQIAVRESVLTGEHPQVRSGPEYEEGRCRLADDAFLGAVASQVRTEIVRDAEAGYGGHGPVRAGVCNFLGRHLGVPVVVKKGAKLPGVQTCVDWPMNVRPPGYYLGAYLPNDPIDEDVAAAARATAEPKAEHLIFPDRSDLVGIGRRLRAIYRFPDVHALITAALEPEHWIATSNVYGLIGELIARPDHDVRILARTLAELGYLDEHAEPFALPSRTESEDDAPACFVMLGVRTPYTEAKIKRAYKRKAKTVHPDAGGDEAAFVILQTAYEEALRIVTGADDVPYAAD